MMIEGTIVKIGICPHGRGVCVGQSCLPYGMGHYSWLVGDSSKVFAKADSCSDCRLEIQD
jgi:hypothetical protein